MTTAGNLLGETFDIFAKGWKTYLPIAIFIQLPFLLARTIALFLDMDTAILVSSVSEQLSNFAAGPLATGAIAFAVFQHYRHQTVKIGESIRYGISRFLPLLGLTLLVALATIGGFFLLVIPGFIAMTGLFVVIPVLMLEETSAREALNRSWNLTKERRLSIFGFIFVLWLVTTLVAFGLGFVSVLAFGFVTIAEWKAQLATGLALGPPLAALQAIGATVAYRELRKEKEGIAEDELAAIFD